MMDVEELIKRLEDPDKYIDAVDDAITAISSLSAKNAEMEKDIRIQTLMQCQEQLAEEKALRLRSAELAAEGAVYLQAKYEAERKRADAAREICLEQQAALMGTPGFERAYAENQFDEAVAAKNAELGTKLHTQELINELAQKENEDQARLLGKSGSIEAALRAELAEERRKRVQLEAFEINVQVNTWKAKYEAERKRADAAREVAVAYEEVEIGNDSRDEAESNVDEAIAAKLQERNGGEVTR